MIVLLIKLTSPGSVLFVQDRYGLNVRKIAVYKFRSMTVCENDAGTLKQAQRTDASVTPLGAVLRRTSLDELPQFFNVLQGRMSVVGPKTARGGAQRAVPQADQGLHVAPQGKPGITGWTQVNGWRGEADTMEKMRKRVEHDLEYIRNWSLWLDVKIVWLTICRSFNDLQAY
ncbi:MAG: sugar transferase [Mariprofundales bacterium]|nr:sugar transferase [Mariprofundales bacterium]